MGTGSIHIGTSGFSYKHWRGNFYPPEVKPAGYLTYYAQHFSTTEINGSFYRLPTEATVENWASEVPKGFLFCPKMSRFLTHMKKLNDPEEPLQRFFNIFSPLKKMLGPVLLQLPEQLPFKPDRVKHFYDLLSTDYRAYSFVIEVRHDSWMCKESLDLMNKHDVGFVIAQSGAGYPYAEVITSRDIYIRFHGPRELYASSYSDEELKAFATKFKAWKKKGYNVWAFFNNDIFGYAPVDAKRLMVMVE